jgi:transcriptional regulator with XRE-family HTH domain
MASTIIVSIPVEKWLIMLQKPSTNHILPQDRSKPREAKQRSLDPVSDCVGQQLRAIRMERKFSIRALAERSGLSVNTLSLIENGKTSPSVNTLHHLAQSLDVPITAFFEEERPKRRVLYQKAGEQKQIDFAQGQMERLGAGFPGMGSEPFITRLELGANSGDQPITYAGRQFIYCLEGHITYIIEDEVYPLAAGDSLIFDAYAPHSWRNTASTISRALLVLCPENSYESPPERYFMP